MCLLSMLGFKSVHFRKCVQFVDRHNVEDGFDQDEISQFVSGNTVSCSVMPIRTDQCFLPFNHHSQHVLVQETRLQTECFVW